MEPVAPAFPTAAPTPATSAVRAGWICVGIGLLTAWFFPLANVFFGIAVILSVVALATHQVRSGLLLLAGALGSSVVCTVLFFCGVLALIAGLFHAAATSARSETRPLAWTMPTPAAIVTSSFPTPYARQTTSIASAPASSATGKPLALDEVTIMLSNGRRDDEIIAATVGRPMLDRIETPEITSLRAFGASERLIDSLRVRPMAGNLQRPTVYVAPLATNSTNVVFTAPATPSSVRTPAATHAPNPAPVDYAARDREIAALDKQIKALDESISDYRIHHAGAKAYIDQMDRTRNDLRRQKWAVEGR